MENQEAFMLETQHVSKHYGKLEVLKDINLQVKKGEVICLIGPSGAGKSTYLRSLNQLETITGGKIFIKGHLLLHREHDHTVEAVSQACVRRYSVFKCVKQESELLLCLLRGEAQYFEHLGLDVSLMDTDRAAAHLGTI